MKKLTVRQQRFVDEYMVDQCAAHAAKRAGFSEKSAARLGFQLLTYPHVAAAIARKQAAIAKKLEVTIESITRELEEARGLAIGEKQTAAAVSASMGKAKLHGLIVEKRHHSGAVGTYDLSKLTDAELERLEEILGPLADAGGDPSGEEATGG